MAQLGPIKLKWLREPHPRLNLARVSDMKAMYKGGDALLSDDEVLSRIFPKYSYESDGVYRERKSRARYENLFALVINQISAGLAQDPVSIDSADSEEEVDPYWKELMDDASPPSKSGADKRTFDQIIRDAVVEALVCGFSWIHADLPAVNEPRGSLAEQEVGGDLRAYLVLWETRLVLNWEERDGELLWVRTYSCEQRADDPTVGRDVKTHTWTIWDSEGWTSYVVQESPSNGKPMPPDEAVIDPSSGGTHSFGRVPWIRFDVCSDKGVQLHVGGLIFSLCKSHFNRQNGEDFQWTQYHYQQLYEFLAPEVAGLDTPISEAQQDPSRAQRRRSPGQVHVRGHQDKAQFIGPNMSGAATGQAAISDLRDSVFRATSQMALSQDTSGAMVKRSAESKKMDSIAQEIVLGAIGKAALTMASATVAMLAAGRGDSEAPKLRGYERFEITDPDTLIERAAVVEGINIPSAAYQVERKLQVALADLGDSVNEETKALIRKQLEQAITQDQLMSVASVGDDEEDEGLDEEGDEEDELSQLDSLLDGEMRSMSDE